MLRIGLVGCGTHANWAVIPAIRGAADRWQLAAVADINPENLKKIDAGDAARFSDHRRMIAEAKLDAVYVATLADTHAAVALDALRAGLHVVCEKPMATSVDDCRAMVDAAEAANRVLAVNFETRYHEDQRQIRRWIDEGRLGRIEAVHIQHFWDAHKVWGPIGERRKRLANLAGALDCGIHKADLTRYFCGGQWAEIVARGRWFGEDLRQPPHLSVLASLDNGVMATLNTSFSYTAFIEPKAYSDVFTLVGTEGVINHQADQIGPSRIHLHSKSLVTSIDSDTHGHDKPMALLLRDVAEAIRTGKRSPEMASGFDGLMAQTYVEEANRQANEQRVDVTAPAV